MKIKVKLNLIQTKQSNQQKQSASASESEPIIKLNSSDWNLLNQLSTTSQSQSQSQSIDRIPISISISTSTSNQNQKPLIIKSTIDSSLPAFNSSTTSSSIYNHFFNQEQIPFNFNPIQLQISPITHLINLNQIYLQSINQSSYQYAQSNQSEFRHQLSSLIIRQSHQIHLKNTYSYKIILTDPVIQGAFDLHSTSLTLLSPSLSNDHQLSNRHTQEDEEDHEAEEDDIEIEPDFLAHSALRHPLMLGSSSTNLQPPLLLKPIPFYDNLSSDSLQAYVRTTTLAQLGVCKHDWVLLHSTSDQHSNQPIRLLKLSVPPNQPNLSSDQILISPILFNQFQSLTFKISPARLHFNLPPRFPILRSLTLARVASPQVGLKQLQPLFLTALSDHFRSQSRILKLHDLVAVPIDSRLSRFLPSNSIGATNDEAGSMENTDLLEMDLDLGPPQTVIFFKVTHLELFPTSIPPPLQPTTQLKKHPNGSTANDVPIDEGEEDPEMSELLENAKLGAILDPNSTKLVQTGLEQTYVPNLAPSLGIHGLPPLDPLDLDHEPTKKLYEILRASSQPDAISYELPYTILISGQRGVGKRTLVSQVAAATGYQLADLNAFSIIGETEVKTSALLETWIERVTSAGPCVLLLRQLEGIARKSQSIETGGREPSIVRILDEALQTLKEKKGKYPVILMGSTAEMDKISIGLLNLFKLKIQLDAPDETERIKILKRLTERDLVSVDVDLRSLGRGTASLVAKDLVTLVSMTRYIGMKRTLKQKKSSIQTIIGSGGIQLRQEDFMKALSETRKGYSDRIGAPKIPDVRWEDIGGLKEVKEAILETLTLPLNRPELFSNGLRKRSGILLFGPPGTGKTMVAKAVATSVGMNFMSVKGPELLDQYIGESEAKVRRVFERARESRPTVIFFDELDSLAPRRGNQGDSGGVMDRIVSQLLAELDSMSTSTGTEGEKKEGGERKGGEVFVIGATNRPDLLDPALLRPGRFEKLVYLGGIESDEKRIEVMRALTRKMKLDEDVKLEEVVQRLKERSRGDEEEEMVVTGADLYSICSDGMMRSMRRITEECEGKQKEEGTEILVKMEDLMGAVDDWNGSVSGNEMKHYRAAQLKFTKEGNLLGVSKKVEVEGEAGEAGEVNGHLDYEGKGKAKEKDDENGNGNGKGKGKEKEDVKGKGKSKSKGKGKEKMI